MNKYFTPSLSCPFANNCQSATDGENDQTSSNVDFSFIAPADIDLFDTDFAFGSNMYATFADATQGFWESFPGSMDITGDMVMEN